MSCDGKRFGLDFAVQTPQNPTLDRILYYDESANDLKETSIQNLVGNSGFDFLPSGVQGDILYHNGSGWVVLNAGTAGQVFTTNGAGANPNWGDASVASTLEREYEYSSNLVTALEKQFRGIDQVSDIDFSISEIDSIYIETRTAGGASYTSRADVTALNAYLASLADTDIIYVRVTTDRTISGFSGKASVTFQYTNV